MKWVIAILLSLSVPTFAQLSPEEAAAKLAEKTAQRQAERSQVVQISAGELTDLREQVARLESQVRMLQAAGSKKTSERKIHRDIEIGMTRDEVMVFIRARPNLRISFQTTDSGVSKEETTVIRKTNGVVSENTGETVTSRGRRGRMTIEKLASRQEDAGSHTEMGGRIVVRDTRTVNAIIGTITVAFLDDVVDGVRESDGRN